MARGLSPPSSWNPILEISGKIGLRVAMAAVALLLLLPHACSSPWFPEEGQVGLARVFSGDEPHYLVILNSLVSDHDWNLANNYEAVHLGGEEAGRAFRAQPLDHHTSWSLGGKYVRWSKVFEMDAKRWRYDRKGYPAPRLAEGVSSIYLPPYEYSYHWPGLPLLLSPLVYPLAGTTYLEPAAIFFSWIITVLGMLALVSLGSTFGVPHWKTALAVILTFLATPAWHYGRTFFTEPYALGLVLGAHALYLGRRRALLAGLLCGLGMMLKNTFIVMALPLGIYMLLRKRWKDAAIFAVLPVASVVGSMLLNKEMYGSYFQGPNTWEEGNILTGTLGLLFSTEHGLLPFAPIAISALIGWPAFFRARPAEATLVAAAFFSMFFLSAAYGLWHAGFCYGPRYIVPVIPLLMLGLMFRFNKPNFRPWHALDIVVLGALSLWINFLGAVPHWNHFSRHPLGAFFQ
jgi:hypothetical protein